jgi:hypothetical protein
VLAGILRMFPADMSYNYLLHMSPISGICRTANEAN